MTEKDVFQNEFFEREKKVRKFKIGFKSRLSAAVCKMVNSLVSKKCQVSLFPWERQYLSLTYNA